MKMNESEPYARHLARCCPHSLYLIFTPTQMRQLLHSPGLTKKKLGYCSAGRRESEEATLKDWECLAKAEERFKGF